MKVILADNTELDVQFCGIDSLGHMQMNIFDTDISSAASILSNPEKTSSILIKYGDGDVVYNGYTVLHYVGLQYGNISAELGREESE